MDTASVAADRPLDGRTAVLFSCIFIGLLLRFANLDQKHYWHDEALTSFYAAGNAAAQLDWTDFRGRDLSPEELVARLQSPRSDRNFHDVIAAQASEVVSHPPLYSLLNHFWMRAFGTAPAIMRLLPALLSALALPVSYWLARELGWRGRAPLLAVALIAVSPFQIAYAQEARQYSLLVLCTLAASAALLRCLRRDHWSWWILYTITLLIGFYTHLLFVAVAAAHSAFVLLSLCLSVRRPFLRFDWRLIKQLAAVSVSALAFWPWVRIAFAPDAGGDGWAAIGLPLPRMIIGLGRLYSAPIVDLYPLPAPLELLGAALALLLFIYSLLYTLRCAGKDSNLLLLLLFAVSVALPLGLDLLSGGQRSTVSRFLTVALVAAQMIVAYTLAAQTAVSSRRAVWTAVTAVVLLTGLLSSTLWVLSPAGSGKGNDESQIDVLARLNSAEQPLVLLNGLDISPTFGDVLGLSHNLDPDVRFYIIDSLTEVPPNRAPLYFYEPSAATLAQFTTARPFVATEVVPGLLWQLQPAS